MRFLQLLLLRYQHLDQRLLLLFAGVVFVRKNLYYFFVVFEFTRFPGVGAGFHESPLGQVERRLACLVLCEE